MGFFGDLLRRRSHKNSTHQSRVSPAETRPAVPLVAAEAQTYLPPCWLDSAAITDVGLVRSNNEDNVRLLPDAEYGVSLALLADGMGGHASGEVASAIALESMMERYQRREVHEALSNVISDLVLKANLAVWQHAQHCPETTGMGTTLCALAFDRQGVFFSWVGDSRIYRLSGNVLQQLTRDDTLVNHLLDEGLLTPDQAKNHPDAHVLSQALGTHEALQRIHLQRLADPVEVGDVFLLTSDGVHDVLSTETMTELLKNDSVHQIAYGLIDAAKKAGSTDNLSAVVVRLVGPKSRQTPMATTRC